MGRGTTTTVGGKTINVVGAPTYTPNVAYADGEAVGGLITFPGVMDGKGGMVIGATLFDGADQGITADLLLFTLEVTGGTDNSAYDPADDVARRIFGVVQFAASAYTSFANNSVCSVGGLALGFNQPRGSVAVAGVASSGGLVSVTTILDHGFSTGKYVQVLGVGGVSGIPSTPTQITVVSSKVFTMDGTTFGGTYVEGTGEVKTAPHDSPQALYGQLVTRGTPTYQASDVQVSLKVLQD